MQSNNATDDEDVDVVAVVGNLGEFNQGSMLHTITFFGDFRQFSTEEIGVFDENEGCDHFLQKQAVF
jgi:hypothetical protein